MKSAALHEMVHLLVIKHLVKENLRDINDRAKSTYLTLLDLSPLSDENFKFYASI